MLTWQVHQQLQQLVGEGCPFVPDLPQNETTGAAEGVYLLEVYYPLIQLESSLLPRWQIHDLQLWDARKKS